AGSGGVVTQVQSVIEKEPTVNVLVSSGNLAVGQRLEEGSVHWMAWPQGGVVPGLITEIEKPDAIKDLQGAVVRLPIFEGEPIRPE
ncbi:Flp pilus assembly protein CpaB, partial [Pseudomonas sp. BGM005]|nr:Flp pilus assembly protein CpaB [Pseudomonas sp. BG5]